MATNNWSALKAAIATIIKNNGNEDITGDVLQANLNSIIDNVGQGAIYSGVATPSTTPPASDGVVFYLASQPGTYTAFSGITISTNGIYVLSNRVDVGQWVKDDILTDIPTIGRVRQNADEKSYVDFVRGGAIFSPRRELFSPTSWTLELSMRIDDATSGSVFITQDVNGVNLVFSNGNLVLSKGGVGDILSFPVTVGTDDVYAIKDTGSNYGVFKNGVAHTFTLINNYRTESVILNDWFVGSFNNESQFINGRVNLIRIWDIAFSDGDFVSLYNDGNPVKRRFIKSEAIRMELCADNANESIWYDTSKYSNKGIIRGDFNIFSISPNIEKGKDLTNIETITPVMYIVVGRELNIYFKSIFPYYDKNKYRVDCDCSVGYADERSYRYAPTVVENGILTITIYDLDRAMVAQKTITIQSIANDIGTGTKQLLFIGDSTTDSYLTDYLPGTGRTPYEMLHEISDMFIADGGAQPLFLGLRGVNPYKHQAHSGYAINNFLINDPSYPNPFYDSGIGGNNFKKYMADNSNFGGADRIDYVVVQLGINDLKNNNELVKTVFNRFKALVGTIQDPTYGYPDAWVLISASPYVCGDKTGWTTAFDANLSYEQYVEDMINLNAQLMEYFWSNPDYPKVYPVPTMAYVDREYGYPRALEDVSARNDFEIYKYADSVHPNKSGYWQAADAIYSALRAAFNF